MSEEKNSDLIELAGLWENTSRAGEKYLSGTVGSGKILILQNKYKTKDNQPDYRAFLAPRKETKAKETSTETEPPPAERLNEEVAF